MLNGVVSCKAASQVILEILLVTWPGFPRNYRQVAFAKKGFVFSGGKGLGAILSARHTPIIVDASELQLFSDKGTTHAQKQPLHYQFTFIPAIGWEEQKAPLYLLEESICLPGVVSEYCKMGV